MMEQAEQAIPARLKQISNILLVNGGFSDIPGLYAGETGLILFFFRYARFTRNELYSDYAFDLLEKIQNSIYKGTPIDYRNGLAGIGAAIEFLIQECYIEADADEILEDFDNRMFSMDNLQELSVEDLDSIAHYAIWRISKYSCKSETIIKSILPKIVKNMEEKCRSNSLAHPTATFINEIILSDNDYMLTDNYSEIRSAWHRLHCRCRLDHFNKTSYNHILAQMDESDFLAKNDIGFGIENGLAGLGLSLICELDAEEYWTALFPYDFSLTANQ
jgi:hypothetical protein